MLFNKLFRSSVGADLSALGGFSDILINKLIWASVGADLSAFRWVQISRSKS
jgi:hypothetical protein